MSLEHLLFLELLCPVKSLLSITKKPKQQGHEKGLGDPSYSVQRQLSGGVHNLSLWPVFRKMYWRSRGDPGALSLCPKSTVHAFTVSV